MHNKCVCVCLRACVHNKLAEKKINFNDLKSRLDSLDLIEVQCSGFFLQINWIMLFRDDLH